MNTFEKDKNLFIINFDENRRCYFNFADGQIYGVSGKVIKDFSNEAKKIIRAEKNNNFIAFYFSEKNNQYAYYDADGWTYPMVETIYSLFSSHYPTKALCVVAQYCKRNNFVLNKKGVKALTSALKSFENADGSVKEFGISDFYSAMVVALNSDIPESTARLMACISSEEIRAIIKKDAKKIAFYCEHECWTSLYDESWAARCLKIYISLCNVLHHERTYKNMLVSLCQMSKEKELLVDKLCADYQKNAPLFFEDENFTILVPTTAQEFKAEADYQDNCVFRSYYPKVKDFETHVVFIRKKEDVNTPFITCEVTNEGRIEQYLTRFNRRVEDEKAIEFREKYQQFLSENF